MVVMTKGNKYSTNVCKHFVGKQSFLIQSEEKEELVL
jgi:hypothetical protein